MKLTLPAITNSFPSTETNSNFDAIEQELQNKVLYRDNPTGEPNQMENTLDMNSNRIINLPLPSSLNEAARLADVLAGVAGNTANLITYTPIGTGGQTRTLQTKTEEFLSDSDYTSLANALARANSALMPLLATPTLDAGVSGAYLRKGFFLGHSVIGNGMTELNAFCGLQGDEYYLNVEQEVRGISYVVRNTRTVADEATLGWDFFGLTGVVVVGAGNTQYIRGNQKAVTGELYFKPPTTGTYAVKKAHNFQANIVELGVGVTLEDWYGYVVNTPATGGTITNGYGMYILPMTGITNAAAIRIAGQDAAGQIQWNNTNIRELATNKLQITLGATIVKEDSSGKLELDLDNRQLVLTDALTATTVGAAGAASALPAQPTGYWRVLIGGIERKIPYYTA